MKLSRLLIVSPFVLLTHVSCKPTGPVDKPTASERVERAATHDSAEPRTPETKTSGAHPPSHSKEKAAGPGMQKPIDRSSCGLPPDIREPDWPRTLAPTTKEDPSLQEEGSFTIAVFPDTQYYASCGELHFPKQGEWVASQVSTRNIVAGIHLGDLTEHNTPSEWEYVTRSLAPLRDEIPLFLASGNHDYGDEGTANERHTLFPEYFGKPSSKTAPTVARQMKDGNLENAYYRLKLRGMTLGVLVLEWSPTHAAVAWAKKTMADFPQDRKIFVTHAYLFHDGSRYDFKNKGLEQPWNPLSYGTAKIDPELPYSKENANPIGAYDGEMLWNELLKDLPGLFLTLNGHVLGDGAGVLTSTGKRGAKVHQVLTNFQMLDEGGLGYLRLIEFSSDGSRMKMKTFSPSLGLFATAADQNFELPIDPPLF